MFFYKVRGFFSFFNTEHYLNPYLCNGVSFSKKSVVDEMTDRELEINKTSYRILKLCTGNNSISDTKNEIACLYNCSIVPQINDDVSKFLHQLNSNFLINYTIKHKSNIIAYLLCKLKLLFQQKRYEIQSDNLLIISFRMFFIVFERFFIYFFICNIGLLFAVFVSAMANHENINPNLIMTFLAYVNLILFGIFSGIAFHESIHVFIYRKKYSGKGFMGKKGISLAFYRQNDYNKISIKIMGGLTVGLVGVLGLLCVRLFVFENSLLWYVFFLTYAIHLINLLPIWGDGKDIVDIIVQRILKSYLNFPK